MFPGTVAGVREPWLDTLEETLAAADEGVGVVTVASVAGRDVEVDEELVRAAARRALLVLASGGDPHRGLDLKGPAVTTFAGELDAEERREQLEDGLFALLDASTGLPHASELVRALLTDRETAWRAYACSLLAEALAEDATT
jgi:hypothetical protein